VLKYLNAWYILSICNDKKKCIHLIKKLFFQVL